MSCHRCQRVIQRAAGRDLAARRQARQGLVPWRLTPHRLDSGQRWSDRQSDLSSAHAGWVRGRAFAVALEALDRVPPYCLGQGGLVRACVLGVDA